ncbi:hypothetical protein DCC81_17935 [Chitinophaga parva]|uniref:Uncharacterized protein n=1 Tax=Chitinophaga parva TaxID=2169414 RepID=A0A2T7BIK4_9BACT|nr:hypothetical protein [Chitinophaga parva]PUZ26119.1 hypothetical protein DCC81_17935 [Chitinophaga parva]
MTQQTIKNICDNYLNKKKGYTAEIDDYKDETKMITFNFRILKNGIFKADQPIRIIKTSELPIEGQLRSQIDRFSALVENNRI